MIKFLRKTTLLVVMTMALLPSIALAERGAVTIKRMEDQANFDRSARLNPYDSENEAILEELGAVIQPVDPIWQNKDFAYFMYLMKEANRLDSQGDTVNALYTIFEAIDVMDTLNHPELTIEKEEREFIDKLRKVIETNTFAFESDPEYFLVEQALIILGESLEQEWAAYEQNLGIESIYAYANPGGYVYPEETVTLMLSSTSLEGLRVSWRQTYGPNVEWLQSTNAIQTSFIVPAHSQGESLIFEYTISRLGQSKTGKIDLTVFQNPYSVFVAPEDGITNIYQSLLGRNPDPDGYVYWKQQYDSGMSLEAITQEFMQSEEYRNLQR